MQFGILNMLCDCTSNLTLSILNKEQTSSFSNLVSSGFQDRTDNELLRLICQRREHRVKDFLKKKNICVESEYYHLESFIKSKLKFKILF